MAIQQFIVDKQVQVAQLCQRLHARRLHVFGSATRPDFKAGASDLDFLVEFDNLPPAAYARSFFALKQGLEDLFSRPVDLLTEDSLKNPYFRQRLEAERVALYGA